MLLTIILIPISVIFITTETVAPMYVCLCKGITDTQIRAAVQDGATSMREVSNALGVASQCGKCGVLARDIVRESLDDLEGNEQLFYAVS
jgi:bacterioferritin-associated ferredoxin